MLVGRVGCTFLSVTPFRSPLRPLLLTAGALGLLLGISGNSASPSGPGRAGREVYRALQSRGEARVLVSFRHATGEGKKGSLPAESPGAFLDRILEGIPASEVKEERRLRSVPVLVARVSFRGLSRLLADPRVSRVDLDGEIYGADTISSAQIGADRVQELGFLGGGITAAVLDSGTDPLANPDLDPDLVGEECFCSNRGGCCPDGSLRQSGAGSAASVASHGPAVIGILTADGILAPAGVAPEARILAIRVLDDDLVGTFSDILAALDWVLENRPEVRLVNMSLAAGLFPAACDHLFAFNEAVAQLSDRFRSRGGLFFAAAGNGGNPALVSTPACVESVVGVGAVSAADLVPGFTNANEGLDLMAPGLQIRTTGSFGRTTSFTGTSASTPHAAGAAALLLSANPSLSAEELEERLEKRGVSVVDPRSGLSYPRVDAFRSLLIPVELALEPPVLSPRSRGRALAARVEPQPPFRAADLDPASLTISLAGGEGLRANLGGIELGDGDGDGIQDLTVHFDRRVLLAAIPGPGIIPVVLDGAFHDGIACRGRAALRILPAAGARSAQEPAP